MILKLGSRQVLNVFTNINNAENLLRCVTRTDLSAIPLTYHFTRSDIIMQFPEWTKPALIGAGAGAVALAILGFGWGGWMTEGAATKLSDENSVAATTKALIPYCVQKSRMDPKSADLLEKINEARSYKRSEMLANTGWATPLGDEKPNLPLVAACLVELTKKS